MADDKISIVIPVLNDVGALKNLLPSLQEYRAQGHEVVLVDGGSLDGSVSYATPHVDRLLMTGTGRGRQMNLGAENAKHDILLFLHADSLLPRESMDAVQNALAVKDRHWGRFDVSLEGAGPAFGVIAFFMNLRSRVSGVATGDQGIFVRKQTFHNAGGYEAIPLMEDIALSKALRKKYRPACLRPRIIASARRWEQRGILRTILLMWYLRLAYFMGVDTAYLARLYYPGNATGNRERVAGDE